MSSQGDDDAAGPQAGMPRWVKWFLVGAAVVVGVGLLVMVLVGGEHGPGRHSGLGPVSTGLTALTGSGSAAGGAR